MARLELQQRSKETRRRKLMRRLWRRPTNVKRSLHVMRVRATSQSSALTPASKTNYFLALKNSAAAAAWGWVSRWLGAFKQSSGGERHCRANSTDEHNPKPTAAAAASTPKADCCRCFNKNNVRRLLFLLMPNACNVDACAANVALANAEAREKAAAAASRNKQQKHKQKQKNKQRQRRSQYYYFLFLFKLNLLYFKSKYFISQLEN